MEGKQNAVRTQVNRETLTDMRVGAMIALALIYLVLAWVFGSYSWPLVIMTIIPYGIVGAIWGHWWMINRCRSHRVSSPIG